MHCVSRRMPPWPNCTGYHGDTPELKQFLKPLMEAHAVDAYLCGHDHVLEYMRETGEEEVEEVCWMCVLVCWVCVCVCWGVRER